MGFMKGAVIIMIHSKIEILWSTSTMQLTDRLDVLVSDTMLDATTGILGSDLLTLVTDSMFDWDMAAAVNNVVLRGCKWHFFQAKK